MANVANTTIKITDQASPALKSISIAINATLNGFEGLERAINENTAALRSARYASNTYNNQQKKTNQTAREGTGVFSSLTAKLGALAAAYLSVQTAQQYITENDAYINNQARFNVMNDGLQTTDELYNKIYQSAQRSIAPVNDVAANVTKLGIVAKEAFKNNDEIISFIEIFNKAATISGSSNSEKSNALYQLSQAFGSGRLQGDELRSVRENAPMLWKAIEKELKKQFGDGADLRKLAADGLISPNVIRNAAFASAKEVNKAFDNMPMSFGDYWIQAGNKIRKSMEPIFKSTMKLINSADFKKSLNTVVNYVIMGIRAVYNGIKKIGAAVMWFRQRWAYIGPAVKVVATAFVVVTGSILAFMGVMKLCAVVMAGYRALIIGLSIAKLAFGGAVGFATMRTIHQTMAQWGLNKAQMVGMILMLKIVAVILLIVGAIWGIVSVINFAAGTTISAIGVIYGTMSVIAAAIWNIVVGKINSFVAYFDASINLITGIIEWVLNVWNGGFNSFGGAVKNLLSNIVSWFLDLGKVVTTVVDAIFGTNWSNGLDKMKGDLMKWGNSGKNEKAITLERNYISNAMGGGFERIGYGNAWGSGYEIGKNFGENPFGTMLGGMGGENEYDIDKMLGNVGDKHLGDISKALDGIGKDVGGIKDDTGKKEDDYKLLRDVMTQRAVTRVSGSNGVNINTVMNNNNNLASNMDLGMVIGVMATKIQEAASTAANGLHN